MALAICTIIYFLTVGGANNIVTGAWVWLAAFGGEPAREVGFLVTGFDVNYYAFIGKFSITVWYDESPKIGSGKFCQFPLKWLHLENSLQVNQCFQSVIIPRASVILVVYLISCVISVPFYVINGGIFSLIWSLNL